MWGCFRVDLGLLEDCAGVAAGVQKKNASFPCLWVFVVRVCTYICTKFWALALRNAVASCQLAVTEGAYILRDMCKVACWREGEGWGGGVRYPHDRERAPARPRHATLLMDCSRAYVL